MDKE
jgi:hypothetical protein